MNKITPLFLGFLLVIGSVNAGLITGAFKWLTKLAEPVAPHIIVHGGKALNRACYKSLDSLRVIYQAASQGVTEAQILLGDELPKYEKKCINKINKELEHPFVGQSLTPIYWYKKAYFEGGFNPVAKQRVGNIITAQLRAAELELGSEKYQINLILGEDYRLFVLGGPVLKDFDNRAEQSRQLEAVLAIAKTKFEAYRLSYKELTVNPNRIKDARINELRRKIIESEFHEYLIK